MIDPRASILIAGCVLFAGLIFAELSGDSDTAAPSAAVPARSGDAPAARRAPPPRLDDLLATSLARPLFSPSRRPPDVAQGDTAGFDLSGNRLTGIITEPDRRFAIFAVTGGKALVVGEGETVGGWRIDTIAPTEISISGPGGTKTLQPKTDPNAVRQAAPVVKPAAPAGPVPPQAAQARPGPAGAPRTQPQPPGPAGQAARPPQASAVPPRSGSPATRANVPATAAAAPRPNVPVQSR